jgi:tetratricopeptide (TPR) repeat protein
MGVTAMRSWFLRGLVVAAAALPASSATLAGQSVPLSVQDAVTLYARGDFTIAVRDLYTPGLKVAPFTRALDAWIAAGDPASEPRRRLVAAAFALDSDWAATREFLNARVPNRDPWKQRSPDDPERVELASFDSQGRVASWVGQHLPATGTPDIAERALWLTAVGIAEDGHAWHRLQDEILPLARKRLPDEPRLRLADVLARTNMDLGPLRFDAWIGRRSDILREEHLLSSVIGRIPQAIRAFEPLLADPAFAGEVELRIGYLELRRRRWPDALARFDATRSKATEPTLRAAADYFTGWVHEQEGHPDDAIAAYRRALAITPMMRNLATRLSALLFLGNERAEAYAVLDPALNARPAPVDLLIAVERADARFVPDWLASIRKALQ